MGEASATCRLLFQHAGPLLQGLLKTFSTLRHFPLKEANDDPEVVAALTLAAGLPLGEEKQLVELAVDRVQIALEHLSYFIDLRCRIAEQVLLLHELVQRGYELLEVI